MKSVGIEQWFGRVQKFLPTLFWLLSKAYALCVMFSLTFLRCLDHKKILPALILQLFWPGCIGRLVMGSACCYLCYYESKLAATLAAYQFNFPHSNPGFLYRVYESHKTCCSLCSSHRAHYKIINATRLKDVFHMEIMFGWCLGLHPISLQVIKQCPQNSNTAKKCWDPPACYCSRQSVCFISDLFLWLWNKEDGRCSQEGYRIRNSSKSPDLMGWNLKADLRAFCVVSKTPSWFYSFSYWEKYFFLLTC